jgi:hypothetical protein
VKASGLGFYTTARRVVPGQSIVSVDDHEVTVAFAGQVGDAMRCLAEASAGTDERGNPPTLPTPASIYVMRFTMSAFERCGIWSASDPDSSGVRVSHDIPSEVVSMKAKHRGDKRARWPVALGSTAAAGAMVVAGVVPALAQGNNPNPNPSPNPSPSSSLHENQQPSQQQQQQHSKAQHNNGPNQSKGNSNGPGGSRGLIENGNQGLKPGQGTIQTHLRLKSAKVTTENLNNNKEYVTFTFSRPITKIANQTGFALSGFSPAARVSSQTAQVIHTKSVRQMMDGRRVAADRGTEPS